MSSQPGTKMSVCTSMVIAVATHDSQLIDYQ